MADDQHELRSVNWGEVFAFTHIFKSWRMAIQPGKLLLGLAVILAIFAVGWIMDALWCAGGTAAASDEIASYVQLPREAFDRQTKSRVDARPGRVATLAVEARNEERTLSQFNRRLGSGLLASIFRDQLNQANAQRSSGARADFDEIRQQAQEDWKDVLEQTQERLDDEAERTQGLLKSSYDQAKSQAKQLPREQREKALDQLCEDYAAAQRALTAWKVDFAREVEAIKGQGIFEALVAWERACVNQAAAAVLRGDLLSGLQPLLARQRGLALVAPPDQPLPIPAAAAEPAGVLYFLAIGWCGLCWLITQHWVYALIFLAVSLLVWSLLGGALYRMAALHAAREEKTSMLQALRYSAGKVFGFFTAPLIPLAIILVMGLLLALAGLLGNIPGGVGALIVGGTFLAAILVGMLIAFLAVGLAAGAGLMYPTIAVEGSDCFDAISRSFSYVFSRPWRAILYGLVALAYGTLCYLFVRLFAFLALLASHTFVGWGIFTGGQRLAAGADRLDVLWTAPTYDQFHAPFNWAAMSGAEAVGAFLLSVWVYLVVAAMGAFLISFFASSTTVIYLLLRRHVDATDLGDVWVEESAQEPVIGQAEAAAPPSGPAAAPEPPAQGPQPPLA